MKKTILRNYAALIARTGINIKKGQEVNITAAPDQMEFLEMLVKECYKAGAGKVNLDLVSQEISKLDYRYASKKKLSTVTKWEEEKLKYNLENLPATIRILSEDPAGLAGINQKKYGEVMQARLKVTKPYRMAMDNKYQWCVAAVPGEAWAKKVFPGMRKSVAVEKLWEAILYTSRADVENPVKAWEEHNADLQKRSAYLNTLNLRSLHYKTEKGTDFTVGLMEDGRFMGGCDTLLDGTVFAPNIPSEEIFTAPKKGSAEGRLYSTMPLSYRGELIENFYFDFKDGKVVDVHADTNENILRELVKMDDGAAFLGEVALVPADSPISNSGILFYNTLFDENASCHFALGQAYTMCVKDFEKYSLEELKEKGVNESIIHVDFMVGDNTLEITGTDKDGKEVAIFRNGNWAF